MITFVVVGVALDHGQTDLLLQLGHPLLGGAQHLAELRVIAVLGHQLPGPGRVVDGPRYSVASLAAGSSSR